MEKYLRQFATHSAYEAAKNNLDLPNVSLCLNENKVHYNPYDPFNGHEYVDLGLPSGTLWATMNIGAIHDYDFGNYYMYGMGSKTYDSSDTRYEGNEDPLALSADTARQMWGGEWHMPTQAQIQELIDNTTYVYEIRAGSPGGAFIAQNNERLHLPAAGGYLLGNISGAYSTGLYWSSTPDDSTSSYIINFNNSGTSVNSYDRLNGFPIRPVIG